MGWRASLVGFLIYFYVFQVKVDKYSFYLSRLQECFRIVNEMVVNVVVFIKLGQEQIEERGKWWGFGSGWGGSECLDIYVFFLVIDIMDFFGLLFIKLKKQEMEIQVGCRFWVYGWFLGLFVFEG